MSELADNQPKIVEVGLRCDYEDGTIISLIVPFKPHVRMHETVRHLRMPEVAPEDNEGRIGLAVEIIAERIKRYWAEDESSVGD